MREQITYKGFCVGGPLDGHWVSEISSGMDVDGFCYRHVRIKEFAEFWIPEDKDETWAFMQLIRSHRAVCDPKATLPLLDRVRHHAYRAEAAASKLLATLVKKPVLVPFMGRGTMPKQSIANTGPREARGSAEVALPPGHGGVRPCLLEGDGCRQETGTT